MSRTAPLLAVAAAAVGLLASRRTRSRVAAPLSRSGLRRGVEEYPSAVVDRRGAGADAVGPARAETPAEIAGAFYTERDPA